MQAKFESRAKNMLTFTRVGIHPGRLETTSSIELTTSRMEAPQPVRTHTVTYELTRDFRPGRPASWVIVTHGQVRGCRPVLILVANAFSWPPVRLRHPRGDMGKSKP